MLDFSVTQANFRFGLAEDTEPHQVPPGTLVTAENCRWQKGGRIEKRYGTTALTRSILGGGTLSAAARLFTRGDELCLIDGAYLHGYAGASTAWRRVDQIPDVGLTSSTLLDPNIGVALSDLALSSGGLLVHAWITGDPTNGTATGALYFQVRDQASGALCFAPARLSSSGNTAVRALTIGTQGFIVTTNGVNVAIWVVDLAAGTVSSTPTNVRTDVVNDGAFDACVIGSNIVLTYSKAASTVLYSYNTSLVQQATATVEGVASTLCSLDGVSGESLYVLYFAAPNVRIAIHNANTLAQAVAPQTVEDLTGLPGIASLAVSRYDSTHCVAAYSPAQQVTLGGGTALTSRTSTYQVSSTGTIATSSARGTWGTLLASRPFMLGGRCYVFLADYPAIFVNSSPPGINTSFVEVAVSPKGPTSNWVPHRYVGKSEHLIGAMTRSGTTLPNVVAASSTSYLVVLPFQSTAPLTGVTWRCGLRLVNATVGPSLPSDMWRSVTYGRESYILGGVLSAYDGRQCFDYGYARAPNVLGMVPGGAGSGHMDAGLYHYTSVLEFRSSAGVLHRSPIGESTATAAANGSVVGVVNGCNHGNKKTLGTGYANAAVQTLLALYRSPLVASVVYRETFEPTYNIALVDELSNTQPFLDDKNTSDITALGSPYTMPLTSRPVVYTTGGILEDEQPPGFTTMMLFQQRLWGVDVTQRQIWYSKSFLDDFGTAPGFSTSFRLQCEAPVSALASLDDKLVAFASDRLWTVLGDGPAANGEGGDYTIIPVQSSVGCTNPRSVVSTSEGVMFLTSRGLFLLTRQLETVFIGGPVQDQLAAYPNVTSAVLVATRNEVRWTCIDAGSTAGVVLVYNYVQQQWSTARYTANSVYGVPFADACIWQGQWTAVTPDGFVLQESESTYLDGAAWVPMTIETAWVSGAGPVGYAAVDSMSLAGVSKSNHDLSISVGFDGEATYAQGPQMFTAGSAVTSVGPLEECKVSIGTRRWCQAIRFKIQDATPTNPGTYPVGTGQGATFDTLGLEIGIERGLRRLPATKRG